MTRQPTREDLQKIVLDLLIQGSNQKWFKPFIKLELSHMAAAIFSDVFGKDLEEKGLMYEVPYVIQEVVDGSSVIYLIDKRTGSSLRMYLTDELAKLGCEWVSPEERRSVNTIVTKTVDEILKEGEESCPLPLQVIPDYMGINLCSVKSISWERRPDNQLTTVTINFDPGE